ncbi:MAG: pyruvate:ferredoxin (flavodoxin) oxidoreductase [Opitutales bacterium]|nr:pyruvate:ferredoxin (flavodoxin) oxidoreductase [Opitutales bacterium]
MVTIPLPPAEKATLDANEAVASVAYRLNEIFAIYPITPSSPMAEFCDEWSAGGKKNVFGEVPSVVQMQSEAGVAGTLHGLLQGGTLTTSFTASQGLLLMIPNLYKIAGELTPFVLHVTARTLATHALSIFGDHSDVMACRATGMGMVASRNVQEAQDMAAITHAATLRALVPLILFFDGFRTSHEVNKISLLSDEVLKNLWPTAEAAEFRRHGLSPERPALRGTAQNPDVFFQAREAANPFYDRAPEILQETMDKFAELTGRAYRLFEYSGHPEAEEVYVAMGSGAETIAETVDWKNRNGGKAGVINVRVYRPFATEAFVELLPKSVRKLIVLDRTKEPGSVGEPLFTDVAGALMQAPTKRREVALHGGIYGLSSKEFTPAMVAGVMEASAKDQLVRHFTVGIEDDVTKRSIPYDETVDITEDDTFSAVFFGLGSDGTVGANKNSIKIIGEETDNHAQGYFVYDSKKSGAVTVSHLRFGPHPIKAPYLIRQADFVGCHQFNLLQRQPVEEYLAPGSTLLINASCPAGQVWDRLPARLQKVICEKEVQVYTIDAYNVAKATGMGGRINTIMQVGFFHLTGVIPQEQAITAIKNAISKTYGRKGPEIVKRNHAAVDAAIAAVKKVDPGNAREEKPTTSPFDEAPDFVQRVTKTINDGFGDRLPVSAFPVDGTWPTGTTRYEKRDLAVEIPVWDPEVCIQCNKCALVCPHAAIRPKFYKEDELAGAPESFKSIKFRSRDHEGYLYTLQVAPEDCTGCTLCVQVCPAKNKSAPKYKAINMEPQEPLMKAEKENYDFFLNLPNPDRATVSNDIKGSQFLEPLFEYSGACAGCGETPYLKLLTQLYGDRLVIANATGCSSIYGGNLPTTPYATDANGKGPAWINSLFEDNAEFGYGLRLAFDQLQGRARHLLRTIAPQIGEKLVNTLTEDRSALEEEMVTARQALAELLPKLEKIESPEARELKVIADNLLPRTVWTVGGDGWAYDIGYGGLDHVLSQPGRTRILILDTEVYSNTGGQCSKATPFGASAKFTIAGKTTGKKDIARQVIDYGGVYVARVAFGAKDIHTLNAFREAESYPGPALIVAYSHCIAHGYDLRNGLEQQKLAMQTGAWPLYRYDPRRREKNLSPLVLDSPRPKVPLDQYLRNELRFRALLQKNDGAGVKIAQAQVEHRFDDLKRLSATLAPEIPEEDL